MNYHTTKYVMYVMDNFVLSKDLSLQTVANACDKYGHYVFCYNECWSPIFKDKYDLINVTIPKLIELGSFNNYHDLNHPDKYHVSAQGNQLITTYDNLIQMFRKFPEYIDYIITAQDIIKSIKEDLNVDQQRNIRSIIDYATSQCFYHTFHFPKEIVYFGETDACLYGCVVTNAFKFKKVLGPFENDKQWPISLDYIEKFKKHINGKDLSSCFCKFSTLRK